MATSWELRIVRWRCGGSAGSCNRLRSAASDQAGLDVVREDSRTLEVVTVRPLPDPRPPPRSGSLARSDPSPVRTARRFGHAPKLPSAAIFPKVGVRVAHPTFSTRNRARRSTTATPRRRRRQHRVDRAQHRRGRRRIVSTDKRRRQGIRGDCYGLDSRMGLLTFSIDVTWTGCVDHQEGIADDETHAFFTRPWTRAGRCCGAASPTAMMESYSPAVARGDEEAPPAMRESAVKLEVQPRYVVSSTRKDFPWDEQPPHRRRPAHGRAGAQGRDPGRRAPR